MFTLIPVSVNSVYVFLSSHLASYNKMCAAVSISSCVSSQNGNPILLKSKAEVLPCVIKFDFVYLLYSAERGTVVCNFLYVRKYPTIPYLRILRVVSLRKSDVINVHPQGSFPQLSIP